MTDQQMTDPREAFADELVRIGDREARLVVLDADVSRTSRTRRFRDRYPDRFYDMGVAEQNMAGVAAGLAATGVIPIAVTFAVFASMRAAEPIRTSICYPRLNAKVVGGYAGLSNGKDGATHQSVEDVAIFRSFPNMTVLAPSDGPSAAAALRVAVAHEGPVYLRLEYEATADIYDERTSFVIGQAVTVRPGRDLTIAAYGLAVGRAIETSRDLALRGIDVEVLDMRSLKPLDEESLLASVTRTGGLVTVEDHSAIGGLGAAAAALLAAHGLAVPFRVVAIADTYTESGSSHELRAKYAVGPAAIAAAAAAVLERRASGRNDR